VIDWHSHVLPGIDDGSRDVAESLAMLEMLKAQGVDTVVATPHFYPDKESLDSFLARREKSFSELSKNLPVNAPRVLLGAEVYYYPGISRMERLKELRIKDSKLLLLEMPMSKWTEYMMRELIELSGHSTKMILAHAERYLDLQKAIDKERIYESGMFIQANAGFFLSFTTKHKAVARLAQGRIQFVGSDCHNTTSRPPKIGKAFDVIRKKLGDEYIDQMNEYGYGLLAHDK
jgi:protein-tyrosine phosphatase